MPNNRTTKRERAAVRRRLPAACRRWGTAHDALADALHVKAQWEWLNASATTAAAAAGRTDA